LRFNASKQLFEFVRFLWRGRHHWLLREVRHLVIRTPTGIRQWILEQRREFALAGRLHRRRRRSSTGLPLEHLRELALLHR